MPPSLAGAILLLARQVAPAWDAWPRTKTETLALVGAGKSQACDFLSRLWTILPSLLGRAGRPPAASPEPGASTAVLKALNTYLCDHPGAVCGRGRRRVYSDGFRRLVVGLIGPGQPGEGMTVAELASASSVPLGTLKDWLQTELAESPQEKAAPDAAATPADTAASLLDGIRSTHLQLVATLWRSWEGTFQAFCAMVRTEYRVPHGMTFIGNFLQAVGGWRLTANSNAMSVIKPPGGFDDLSIDEQLSYVHELWDRISDRVESSRAPEWHEQIVNDRLQQHLNAPGDVRRWDEVRDRLRARLRKAQE